MFSISAKARTGAAIRVSPALVVFDVSSVLNCRELVVFSFCDTAPRRGGELESQLPRRLSRERLRSHATPKSGSHHAQTEKITCGLHLWSFRFSRLTRY